MKTNNHSGRANGNTTLDKRKNEGTKRNIFHAALLSLFPRFPIARNYRRTLHNCLLVERLEERTVFSSSAGDIGGAGQEFPWAAHATDPSGNTFLSGKFDSQPTDFDPGPGVFNLSSAGGSDAFIAKYGSDSSLCHRSLSAGLG